MNHNSINAYDADIHVAEIYDQSENRQADVDLILTLLGGVGPLKILEPFCGTGRLLIPLALHGHTVFGMDQSAGMLNRARQKIRELPLGLQQRIDLIRADVLCEEWPVGFDLVILGCNCFYELAVPDEQETCVRQAARCLNPGGYVFIDNDHMEGELAASWQNIGVVEPSLSGTCADGTIVKSTRETLWFDAPGRLVRFRRCTKVTRPDGSIVEQDYLQQKHPVSQLEVQGWLEKHGFAVEGMYGNYAGQSYTHAAPRAIFWARRKE